MTSSINILDNDCYSTTFTFNGAMYTICKEEDELFANGPSNGLSMEVEQDCELEQAVYIFRDFSIVTDSNEAYVQ